jgi:uncharacterized protein YhfF
MIGAMYDKTPETEAYWQRYLAAVPAAERAARPDYLVYDFGSTPESADALAELVRWGVKRATSDLLWALELDETAPFPTVGEVNVILDGRGQPACIIELTEVETRPFNAIDDAFAYDYGEGDRSLAWWRREMGEYYAAQCRALGRRPVEDMPVVCLRFRLLYPI